MANLESYYLGLKLKSPVIVASSGLTKSIEKIVEFEKFGAGAVVLKSLFEEQIRFEYNKSIEASENGFNYPEAEDYIRQYTTANEVAEYVQLIKEAKRSISIPVIASVNCVSSEEWPNFALEIERAGADAIELNIFILPTNKNLDTATIENQYFGIVKAVRNNTKLPISVKIGHGFTNPAQFIHKLSCLDIQGIVLFNRAFRTDFDLEKMKIVSGSIFSNPDELNETLRWVAITSADTRCDLCASVGIYDGQSALKALAAGAKTVQVASAFYKKGTEIVSKMNQEMSQWLDTHNYKSISGIIGKMAYKSSANPSAYERVQFMKYFSGIE